LDEYRLDATSPFVCKTLPSRQGRASILSSASAYCFSATEIAESYKLRVTAENNTCAYFRLVPLSSNSGMSMIKDTGSGHRLSGLTHDLSRLSVASSNDSVIDLTIAEETNVNEKVPKSFVYPMNDLSKKSSESSEEDNTKQRVSLSCLLALSEFTKLGNFTCLFYRTWLGIYQTRKFYMFVLQNMAC
jgi:hypothetical protein